MSEFDHHRRLCWRIKRKIDEFLTNGCSREAVDYVWELIQHPRVAHVYFESDLGKDTAPLLVIRRGKMPKAGVPRLLEALRPYYRAPQGAGGWNSLGCGSGMLAPHGKRYIWSGPLPEHA